MRRDPIPFLRALFTSATLCTVAFGQYTLVERAWPIACNQNDEFTAIAAGRLVKNYAPRCVAVTHDQRLWLVAQPTLLWAVSDVTPAGVASVHSIATLVAPPTAEADRLAVITNNGLQVVRDAGTGQMVSASAPLAVWSTMRNIEAYSGVGGNPDLHLIAGVNDANDNRRLRMVHYNAATEQFSNPVELILPSAIFDVTIGDRDADSAPEVTVVGALGLALYSPTGVFITGYAQALTQGFVVARRDAYRNIVMLVNASGTWFLLSFTPANALVGHGVVPGGFTSPVRGIVVGAYDSDAHADLIVSTEATVRWCIPGQSNGGLQVAGIASITDSSSASNGAANRCPALLDDIDRNGKLDLVIASTAHSALIAMNAVAALSESVFVAESGPGSYWASFDLVWPVATSSMMGAKFVVPPDTTSAQVILWRMPNFQGATGVDATGVANLLCDVANGPSLPGLYTENGETLLTTKLLLTGANGSNLFDGDEHWPGGESFMVEVHASSDEGMTTSAVFTFAAEKPSETWQQLIERLVIPTEYPAFGWLGVSGFDQGTGLPLSLSAGNGEESGGGDRYVGGFVPVPVRVLPKFKNLPPPQPIN